MLKGGVYFPGRCEGFTDKARNKLPAREIPLTIVDSGCMFWVERPPKDNDEKLPIQGDDYQGGE